MRAAAPLRRCAASLRTALRRSPPLPAPRRALAAAAAQDGAEIYSRPRLYDVAFGLRDFSAELDFLMSVSAAHAGGTPPASFLELACGPARHARAAAQRGVRAVGLDASAAMLAYAAEQQAAQPAAHRATFALGDMRAADTHADVAAAAPFDLVACLLGSFSHCVTLADAAACLRSAAALLSRRGVLVLELTHPRELFNGNAAAAARRPARTAGGDAAAGEASPHDSGEWEVPFWDAFEDGVEPGAPGLHVCVEWGAPGDAFCPLTQVLQRTVSLTAWEGPPAPDDVAELGPPAAEITTVVPARLFTLPELQLLAMNAGLRVAAVHGDLAADACPRAKDAHSMVLVLAHARQEGQAARGEWDV
jgi:SAM-dependent methyltransferase